MDLLENLSKTNNNEDISILNETYNTQSTSISTPESNEDKTKQSSNSTNSKNRTSIFKKIFQKKSKKSNNQTLLDKISHEE